MDLNRDPPWHFVVVIEVTDPFPSIPSITDAHFSIIRAS